MSDSIDPDLRDIEAELLRLRPAPVPRRLERAVGQALRPPAPPWRRVSLRVALAFGFGAGALAAAIIAGLLLRPAPSATAAPALADFKPLSAESVVASTKDDGEVVLSDGTHARRVETAVVDTVTWKDPRTRATVSWSAPSGEVRFIPVSYQ